MNNLLSNKWLFNFSLILELSIPLVWLAYEYVYLYFMSSCRAPQTMGAAPCDQYLGLATIIGSVFLWLPSVVAYVVIALIARKLRKTGSNKTRMVYIALAVLPVVTLTIPFVNSWVG